MQQSAVTRPIKTARSPLGALITGLVAAVALVAGALVVAPAAQASAPAAVPLAASSRLASFDAEMLSLVNGARASAGVPTLHSASGLTSLAVWWSGKMADGATGYQLEHNPNAWTMVTQYGASNRTAWAENVASFSSGASAQAVFNAYMASPGHRANILSSKYHYIGVGTMSGSKGAFNTMEFTDKVDGAPAPSKSTTKKTTAKKTTTKATVTKTTKATTAKKTTAKAAPSTTRAPVTKATIDKTTTHAAPTTHAQTQPAVDRPQAMNNPQSVAKAAPKPQAGTLATSFGALGLPGAQVAIRKADCSTTVRSAKTGPDGRVSVTAVPGTYCAVVTALPDGVSTPKTVTFTVRAGQSFTVAWDNLQAAPPCWSARPEYLLSPV